MINLGILLEGSTSGGGIYQYNLSILNALNSLNTSEYQITVFYFKKDWVSLIPSGFKKVKVYQFKFLRGLGRAYNLIDRTEFGCPECNTSLIKGYNDLLFCSDCKYKEEL